MADKAVGDERVIGSVHSQAVHRLHARVCHRCDARVVEAAVGQLRSDGAHISVGDMAQGTAVALPPGESVDVVLSQPFLISPTSAAVRADKRGKAWNVISIQAGSLVRQ